MERDHENRDAPHMAKDQADRLAQLLYRRNAHARDLLGGSNARILGDASEAAETLASAVAWFDEHRPQWGPGTLPTWYVDAKTIFSET